MTLTETLLAKNKEGRGKIPANILEIMDAATNDLIKNQISKNALKVGDTFPSFKLPNVIGTEKKLEELTGNKATIISFYRGGWCPYCNIELQALQTALPEFKILGANLLAITPETPDNSLNTSDKNKLSFDVLSDINNNLSKEMGLVIKLPKDLQEVYSIFSIDIEKHNQNKDFELPIPATYVIDNKNIIRYAFVKEDYTKRADIIDIKSALELT